MNFWPNILSPVLLKNIYRYLLGIKLPRYSIGDTVCFTEVLRNNQKKGIITGVHEQSLTGMYDEPLFTREISFKYNILVEGGKYSASVYREHRIGRCRTLLVEKVVNDNNK